MMSVNSCAITEVLVAIGDSYWRCVSCQMQFSRHYSIDEHVMRKHGAHPQSQSSHLPPCSSMSSYQAPSTRNPALDNIVSINAVGHQTHVSVPGIFKINLDHSNEEKLVISNQERHSAPPSSLNSSYTMQSVCSRDDIDITMHSVDNRNEGQTYPNADGMRGKHDLLSSDTTSKRKGMKSSVSSIVDSTDNICDMNKLDDDSEVDRGSKSLLNTMLTLLEKSMDIDDLNGVIQNWESLNPELFEQQLLNNNADLSLNSNCCPLDSSGTSLNTAEDLLNTAVETLDSSMDFLAPQNQFLQPPVMENNSKSEESAGTSGPADNNKFCSDNTTDDGYHNSENTKDSELMEIEGEGDAEKKKNTSDTVLVSLRENEGSSFDFTHSVPTYDENTVHIDYQADDGAKNEKGDTGDEEEKDEENETEHNIINFVKEYLEHFTSLNHLSTFQVPERQFVRHGANSSTIYSENSCSSHQEDDANSYGGSCRPSSSKPAVGPDNECEYFQRSKHDNMQEKNQENKLQICTPESATLARMCLRKSKLGSRPKGFPSLVIGSSSSPLYRLTSKPSQVSHSNQEHSRYQVGRTGISLSYQNISSECTGLTKSDDGPSAYEEENTYSTCDSATYNKHEIMRTTDILSLDKALSSSSGNLNHGHSSFMGYETQYLHSFATERKEAESASTEMMKESETVEELSRDGNNEMKGMCGTLTAFQIRKLKKNVLAIMKNQLKAKKRQNFKTSSKHTDRQSSSRKKLGARTVSKATKMGSSGNASSQKGKMCHVCDRRFSTEAALQRHMKVNELFTDACKCKVCGKKFHCLSHLNIHIYQDHETKGRPSCFSCNTYYINVRCLLQHVQKHHSAAESESPKPKPFISPSKSKAWKCSTCGVILFNQPHIIAAHKCKGNPSPQNKCKQCDKKFSSRSALNVHKATHLGRMYECDLCGQFFKNKTSRHYHKLMHESVKGEFLCQVCGRQFEFQDKLTAHAKIHSKVKPTKPVFTCGDCNREYKSKKSLQRHVDVVHKGIKDYQYKCERCSQQFFSSWQLRDHIAWHHFGEKPYHCQFCGQGFVCRPTLVRHQRKEHTGVKPHKCRYCDEAFVDKKNLDTHEVKVHTGVFPYVCSQCGKGYVHAPSLREHMKLHKHKRPHQCHMCGNCFTKTSHLNRHTKSCVKKDAPAPPMNHTLSLDLENLPDIPTRPPSSLTPFMLPQTDDDLLQFSGNFLTQNF